MIHQVSIWGKLVIFGQTDTHTHSYILSFNDALILVMVQTSQLTFTTNLSTFQELHMKFEIRFRTW